MSVTVRCDWFSAVLPAGETLRVVGWLEDRLGSDAVGLGSVKPYPYNVGCVVDPHAYVKWKGRIDEFHKPHYDDFPALVELGGRCLGQWDWDALASFWCEMRAIGARATRLDLAVDDYAKRVDFKRLFRACEVGQFAPMKSHDPRGDSETGRTMYIGRRGGDGSGTFYRIYEKDKQPKSTIDAHRIEVEFGNVGNSADNVWREVFDTPPGGGCTDQDFFTRRAFELVGGSVQLPTCKFWKEIFGDVPSYRAADPPKPPNEELEKAWQNLIRSAMPSLAALRLHYVNKHRECEFDARLIQEMLSAESRFSKHHFKLAGEPQKEFFDEQLPF